MGASVLLLLSAAVFSIGLAHPTTFQCSRYCKEDWSKFGYEVGSSYKYNYYGDIKTTVNATNKDGINAQSRLQFTTQVQISIHSPCDYVMQVSNVNLEEAYINKGVTKTHSPEKNELLKIALTKHPLYFSFQNGRIESICPEEEDDEILHIKKAILSAFQNSMPNLEQNSIVYETDVSGNCETQYQIEDSVSNLVIRKTKNLEACSHRKYRHLSWLSVPHFRNTDKRSVSLLRSTQTCTQKFNEELVLESTRCSEEHLFRPFSNGNNGAATYLTQSLEFLSKTKNIPILKLPKNFRHETLLSSYNSNTKTKAKEILSINNVLDYLERKTKDGVDPDVPRLFSQLVHKLQDLDHNSMVNVFQAVKLSAKKKKFLLDAMPLITTVDGINTMKMLYDQGEVTDSQINSWLGSLIFLKDVSLPIIKSVTPLIELNKSVKQKAVLSVSTLVYMYCKKDVRCLDTEEIQEVVDIIQKPLVSGCSPTNPENHDAILLALKGIGNLGILSSLDYLRNCYSNNDSSMELRLAAIAAHRRINCAENDNLEQFEDYFADIRENTELRIAAYLAVMQCASYSTFVRVKDVLRNEETNQVGSFVWTHLTNLQESSSQWKHNLKSLVQNEFLRNKFSTDMRKYSRNYEVSTFFDSLNTGATVESNVVFTSESYLPKSAMLNFTLDLFGEAVNIFEIGARVEGFEQIVENLFGPEGYFPEESIRNVLENARINRNDSRDKIQELRNSFTSQTTYKEPTGLLYAKIFGSEISYTNFKDLDGLVGGPINSKTILDALMKLFIQQDVDYTKSFVFLDSSYKVPTLLGFPLELAINGTATIGLTVKGKMDLKDLWAQKLAIEGKIYPSAAVEIIGTMTVHSFAGKIGLQSVNTLNSNTYFDGHAFINKGKLVDLKLNVPKKQMTIINVESEVFLLQSNRAYPMEDVTNIVEDWQGCTQKPFSTVTGLELCYGLRYVNASMSPHAPYFPLTGKFKYSMDIKKTDSFDSYQLSLKMHTETRNFRPVYSMLLYFDTPNSTIDRKIRMFYLLDCEKLSLNATLASPFINLEINSKIGEDYDNLGFILQTKLNNNEMLLANMYLKSEKIGNRWKYEPLAEIKYKNKQILTLSGNVNYLQGTKYSADFKFEGISNEPVLVSGDLQLVSKEFQLTASIKSTDINGNARATVIKKPESLAISAKTTYDYKDLKQQVLDFEFNQHTLMKETVSEESLYLSVNSTQKPLYNTLLSVSVQRDKLYLETKGVLTLFEETWETHQLFKFFRSDGNNDIALKYSLKCAEKNIDYDIVLAHVISDTAFKIHGLLQLNKIQRLEALVHYKRQPEANQTLDVLFYYPRQAWIANGIFDRRTEQKYAVLVKTFYELNTVRRPLLVISGEYINSTVAHFQNHTLMATVEIPESDGALDTPWMISSSLQISPDLFLNTAQFRTRYDLYISHMTWTQNSFSGLLQINDKQLLAVNGLKTSEEVSILLGLNIYQHFEISSKLTMPYKKFELILYWDKDRDINQKFALYIERHINKGLYLVDLEYPHQRVSASFILLPTQVTMNVTWGIDSTQRIYLKAGNKIYDIGGIWFAKLETPFVYLENQGFKLSYYILPQNAELKLDVSWRDQKIVLLMSGIKSISHISGNLDINTTIPEISKISVAVSHSHNITDGLMKIKNDAVFVFNEHQISGQSIWQSRGMNVSSSFEIVSSSNIIRPITGSLHMSNNQTTNHFSGFVSWRNKRISVDYKFENAQSYIKIKTPFEGLEVTELDYTLLGEADRLILEVRMNLLTQLNYALLSWNNEDYSSTVKFEITCPIIGRYKIMFRHSTIFGHLEEYLVITQGINNDIVAVELHGDLVPILLMDVTASIKFLEHKASLIIKNTLQPTKLALEAHWNQNYITSVITIAFEEQEIVDMRWDVTSTLLNENMSCRYLHQNTSYIVAITLPKGYKLNNVLDMDNYKTLENILHVRTASGSGSLRYSHILGLDDGIFNHQLVLNMNNSESKFSLNYNINQEISFVDTAFMKFATPWHYPITFNFSMPKGDENAWKPSFYLVYNDKTMLSIESQLKVKHLSSDIHVSFDLPYTVPFEVHAKYDFAKPTNTINILVTEEDTFLDMACEFYFDQFFGTLSLNATTTSLEERKEYVIASLLYDTRNPLKVANFKVSFPEQRHQFHFEASTVSDKNVRKANVLLLSTIPEWEKAYVDLLVGLSEDQSYITIGKNDQILTAKYVLEKFEENGLVICKGKLTLISDFKMIKNGSLELLYKGDDKFQEVVLNLSTDKYKSSFIGNYELTNETNKGVQSMSLNGTINIKHYQILGNTPISIFDIEAKMKGSAEIKKLSGKIKADFNSNIPVLEKVDVEADYELLKRGHSVKAALGHNQDYYSIKHNLNLYSNKLEVSVDFHSPLTLYGKASGKLISLKDNDSVETELLFERNSQLYNISMSTKYDSLLSSDTVIKIATPDKKYKGGIRGNITLAETNIKLYATIDGDLNQVEILMKAKNYKKSEIYMNIDLISFQLSPRTIDAKYDFSSSRRSLSIRTNDNHGAALEAALDKQKLHVNLDTPTVKNFVVVSGNHRLNDINDLSISYAIYFNDHKIKIDLANKVDEGRTTSLDIMTTFKDWNRIIFMNTIYDEKFEVLIDFKSHTIAVAANKNALFNNKELLSIEYNKAPLVTAWSGSDNSYLTSLSPWGNYKFLVNYQANPKMYAFSIFQDGRKIVCLKVDNIHTEEYFDFTAKMIAPFFPNYSNLSAYFYTDYEIPNEFRFTLHNGLETIVALSYNFELKENNYLAVFDFSSQLHALQAFSLSFNFNPQFLLEFEISKTQYDVTKLYQLTIALPIHSDESQLEIGYPWQNTYCYISLFMKHNRIDFYIKTPLKNWKEAALRANLNKFDDLVTGALELRKNSAHATAEWSIGYDRDATIVNIDIKNSLSSKDKDKVIVNGRYTPGKELQIFCDIAEFGNKINLDYHIEGLGMELKTDVLLPEFILEKLQSNISITRIDKADITIDINNHKLLNFTAHHNIFSSSVAFAKIYLNIYESLYYYDVNLNCNYRNYSEPHITGFLNSKTYNYLLSAKFKGQVHSSILNGNVNATIVKGWDFEPTPEEDSYQIAWLIKRTQQERTAKISYQQNNDLTYVDAHHSYAHNRLKSSLTTVCGGRALNLILDGNLSPDLSYAAITLTTPLKELSHLKFETSLTRANGTFKFHNILSWPDQQNLVLDFATFQQIDGIAIDLLFSSPFNQLLTAEINYNLNNDKFEFNSAYSLGRNKIAFTGTAVPKMFYTTSFTSPFKGYKSLNFTTWLNMPSHTARIYFERESSEIELTGIIKKGENNVHLVKLIANNQDGSQNHSFAEILLKIDTSKMNGKAEISWKNSNAQITLSYDPKNLLLEMNTPFAAAETVRLQGQYFNELNSHNLYANGVWNKAVVSFQGSLFAEDKNLTVDSQIRINDNYNGILKFHSSIVDNNRAIHFNAYFPNKEAEVNFRFTTDKRRTGTKAQISLSTPFETAKSLFAETVTENGYLAATLRTNVFEQEVKSIFKLSFKTSTQVEAVLVIDVPQIDSNWEIVTDINIYEQGVLKIAYDTPADANTLRLSYEIVDSVLISHFTMNGTKANVSHALNLHFKNQYNQKEYGLTLDEYTFRYEYTSRFYYQMEGFLQVYVPYFDIKSDGWFMANLLNNKAKGNCSYNNYDVNFEIEKGYSVINARTSFNLGKYNSGRIYTEIELLKDGVFLQNKISDVEGLWLNSTLTYINNRRAITIESWTKHSLLKPFVANVHISKSLDKIYADIQDILKIDMEYTSKLLKVHAYKDVYNFRIDFKDSNFSFNINAPIFEPENLELTFGWSTKNKGKRLDFHYSELNSSVLSGSVDFNCNELTDESTEYVLIANAYGFKEMVLDFSSKILITNVTQGSASLKMLHQNSHAYFLLSPNDPYMAGLTVGSPFLPYDGFTLETGTSVNSTSIFVFAGAGPSDLLEKGFIHLESHEKYILFEARREENKIFVKYEAPAISWLRLVDLQAELDAQSHYVKFFENLEVKSDITDNFSLNSKFNVLQSGIESEIHLLLPFFVVLPKFNAELYVPFSFSNNFNPKLLIELPTTTYLVYATYKHKYNQFTVSGGYQRDENNFNAHFQLRNYHLSLPPTIFAEINLPYGKYKHYAFSLQKRNHINNEHEVQSYLEAFNTRSQLNYSLIYKRDHQLFKILLITPFKSYEKFSLNLEYQNDQERKLKVLLFYPSLPRECGFDFDLVYRNIKEFKLDAKIALPTEVNGFSYGEFVITHNLNLKGKNKSHAFLCFTKINNFNASFDLSTALSSTFVNFKLNTIIRDRKFFANVKSVGNIFDNMDFLFELQTPLKIVHNVRLFLMSSINLQQGIHAGVVFNSNNLTQLDFTVRKGEVFLRFDNIWKPLLAHYQYSYNEDLRAAARLCWNLNHPDTSQIGGHLIFGKNISTGLILPTRTINLDANYFIDEHNEYYFGRLSWYKGKEVAITLSFTNYTSNDIIFLRSAAVLTLPFRTFEIIEEAEANFQQSFGVKSTFIFKWDSNDNSKVMLQNYILPGKLESKLMLPALKDDIILKIDVSSLTKIPSHLKAQLEYSKDIEKRVEFEMFYDKIFTNTFKTERRLILKHPASKIDYSLHFSTTRTPEFTVGNITLHYTNYLLNRQEQIRSSLKIGHEKLEVAGEIETSKNFLSIKGVSRSGIYFQGFLASLQANKKEPLIMEGIYNFKPTGSSLAFAASYGDSRKYDFYAGLPSKREITTKLVHKVYNTEVVDWLFTLKLNSSQILWLKLNWKNEFLSQFHKTILEEYNDLKFILEGTGQQLIDVIEDDFGQKLITDMSEIQKNVTSYTKREANYLTKNYNQFVNDVKEGYNTNSFYVKDIKRITETLFPNLDVFEAILLKPVWDFIELLYKGAVTTIDDMFSSLRHVCLTIHSQVEYSIEEIKDIKKLKHRAKEILKTGIDDARDSLKQLDILVAKLMDSIDEYVTATKEQCEEFFEPYLKLMDDFVIYVEQRLAILQMLVLDVLETVQHYVLNLRESREILKIYVLYVNWLEELHITDVLEPLGDVIEAILDTIITDIKKIIDDYRPYIDAISEAIFGDYRDLSKLPPVTEFREKFNQAYQRTLWIWNYHNLSDTIKNSIHKLISDFDDYLASLIRVDDTGNDFENVLGQSDYIFRPDIGIIEITQPLPVEWEAFDEMPYFEQHPLYNKIKKRTENLIQLQRHHLSDIVTTISSYIGESPKALLSPPTNNVAMVVGKSHYLTFDKKYYTFAGDCSYLLASDFITKTFSVVINYVTVNGVAKKKSISVMSDDNNLEISPDFMVALNNAETDLPLIVGSLTVTLENSEIIIDNSKGLQVMCNLYYDYCTVELSGWLFGKTGGLLGTLDNEKVTDMSLPDGDRTSDVLEFVQSWHVGPSKCHDVNHANDMTKTNVSPLSTTLFETLCQVFFVNANSPFGQCFSRVDPKPFYEMCINNMKDLVNPTMCSSAAAYKTQCTKSNIIIETPEMCVHCKSGLGLTEEIFDRDNPKSIDIVIIKESACFDNDYDFSSFPIEINNALAAKGFKDNLFAVVGYGGSINKPYVYTSNKQIWSTAEHAAVNAKLNSSGDAQYKVSAADAIKFASNFDFRSGVSKLFILMQCDYYSEYENLNNFHTMFGEKDITFHVLKAKLLNSSDGHLLEVDNKGHILYVQQGFNIIDLDSEPMNSTIIQGVPYELSDIYSLLALSTNGTVLYRNNKTNRKTDQISTSWAKIISYTAKQSPCQRCKCITNPDGTGRVECTRCMSPIVKQLLNEYESNIMEFHTDHESEEYV